MSDSKVTPEPFDTIERTASTDEVRKTIEIYPVENLGQVLALALRGATFREGRLLFGDQVPGDVAPLQAFHH